MRIELSTGENWIKWNTAADPGFPVGEEPSLLFAKSDDKKTHETEKQCVHGEAKFYKSSGICNFFTLAIWEKLYWNFVVRLFRNTNFLCNILTSWKSIFEMKNNKSYLLNICDLFLQQELALTPPGVSLVVWILLTLHDTHIPLPTESLKLPGSQSTHTDDAFSVLPTSQTKIRKSKVNLC